jgi:hypothetical protein
MDGVMRLVADFMLLAWSLWFARMYYKPTIQCFVSLFGFSFVIQTQIGKFTNVEFEGGC